MSMASKTIEKNYTPTNHDPTVKKDLKFLKDDNEEQNPFLVGSDKQMYSCEKCDFTTIHKNGLLSHLGTVHSSAAKMFKCVKCKFASAKNRNLWKHMRRVHGQVAKPKRPKCTVCDNVQCTCKILFSCSKCPYSAKQKLHLVSHVARVHEGDKKFVCDECGSSFLRSSNLRKHKIDTHGEKHLNCDRCSYKTAHNRGLRNHIQFVHEGVKPYKCIYKDCDFVGTSTKSKLDEHLLINHQHEYKCQSCEYKTNVRIDLVKHTKLSHLKCEFCDMSFDKKIHLTNHMIDIHPNIKPFTCNLCAYATADQILLKRHQKLTHSDNKQPLSCSHCSFVTLRQDSLTKHEKYIHSGKEKPYKCVYVNCSTSTYTQAKLNTHIRRKHVEGRHHYMDEKSAEWQQALQEARDQSHTPNNESETSISKELDDSHQLHKTSRLTIDFLQDDDLTNPEKCYQSSTDDSEQEKPSTTNIASVDVVEREYYNNAIPEEIRVSAIRPKYITSQGPEVEVLQKPHSNNAFQNSLCDNYGANEQYSNKHLMTSHPGCVDVSNLSESSLQISIADIRQDADADTDKTLSRDQCNYFPDKKYLSDCNVENLHTTAKSFACDKCDFQTTYKYGLDKHTKVVHDNYKPHQCTYENCSFKGTANKANLDLHIRAVHLKIKDHVCDLCGYATVDKHTLLSHKKGVHDGIKDLICATCGYATSYPKALQRHVKVVHETKKPASNEIVRDHVCSKCGFATHCKKNLSDHIKRRHESLDDKICATCGFTTNTQSNLNAHVRRRHEELFEDSVKTMYCDRCTYTTNRSFCLKQHKKAAHDRIKDKKCTECGFETSYAGALKNHINEVHSSAKVSVKCTLCSYTTNRTRNLKTHVMSVHYKIKPMGGKKGVKMQIHQNLDSGTVNKPNSPTDSNITINWPIATE